MVEFMRRRRRLPVVRNEPPPARLEPLVGGDRPPAPLRTRRPGERPEKGRVVAVFGPNGLGVEKLLGILTEEAQGTLLCLRGDGATALEALGEEVEGAIRTGVEVVFVWGVPVEAPEVQWLYNHRYVSPAGGILLRATRGDYYDPHFEAALPGIEAEIHAYTLPYRVVGVEDPVVAATILFNAAELS